MPRFGWIGFLAGLAIFTASCIHEPGPQADALYVAVPPPPDPVELEGSAPSPSYVWVTGRYDWNGFEYVWIPGLWEPRPSARAVWISGRWEHMSRGWVWVEGHWG
ncbi:MAG TPA: hypothetical protein VNO21_17735 [Polyangiaceae bacterium]|nr:hypothetical protein [Polyangiaceae bacterium]